MKLALSAAFALGLALGACATADTSPGAHVGNYVGNHVGTSESALIARLGPPASVEEVGGTRYLGYRRVRSSYLPAATPFYQPICPPSVCAPIGGTHGYMLKEACTTIFAVSDGKVAGWHREGAGCVAETGK